LENEEEFGTEGSQPILPSKYEARHAFKQLPGHVVVMLNLKTPNIKSLHALIGWFVFRGPGEFGVANTASNDLDLL